MPHVGKLFFFEYKSALKHARGLSSHGHQKNNYSELLYFEAGLRYTSRVLDSLQNSDYIYFNFSSWN
jgi:hypothetical protein